jgi:DNA-binding transcriptional MerR regulator
MNSNEEFKAIDVDYDEVTKKNIRGRALFYSTSQVATILDVADSKVRYYTKVFDDLLHIEISNKQRRYTDDDIEKLKFLVSLKEDGLTIKQIQEYCEEIDWDDNKGIQIKEDNPLHIQTVAKALAEEQSKLMESFKSDLLRTLKENMQNQYSMIENFGVNLKNEIKEEVALTVDDVVSEKFEEQKCFIQNMLDEVELTQRNRDLELIDKLQNSLIDKKTKEEHTKKGFLSRLLGK